jgi:RNA polymerase sigma-70 factor (ECF subfamily)
LKSWLFTLAKNKSLNFLKNHSHKNIAQTNIEKISSTSDLEAQVIEHSLLRKLEAAENDLPEELYTTWNLRKQGYDYQEIALKLSIPVGTVKSRFHRLVEFMREELK